jgi:predicted TIM-barrel fold metal-dependent hydrolase
MTSRIISADSHIVEPADFWTAFIDKRFAEQAPHAVADEKGVVNFFVDRDKPLGSVGAPSLAGVRFEDPGKVTFEGTWDDVRPGSFDPVARLKDMELDGISGEVIHPTLGARLYGVVGGDLLTACCRAGNEWLIRHFLEVNAKAFKCLAQLNVDDVPAAVAELQRCVKKGMSGAMIPTYPGEAYPYDDRIYEPLWAAAQDLDVPIVFHIGSTRQGPGQLALFAGDWKKPGAASYRVSQDYWVRRSVANMIFAGVFARFPGLRASIIEHELTWAIYWVRKMDSTYKELNQTAPYRFKDEMLPSDFFRSYIYFSFMEDKLGLEVLPTLIGSDTLMFGSDYPHAESTWPKSREFLADIFLNVAPADREKFTNRNAARLYKFDL